MINEVSYFYEYKNPGWVVEDFYTEVSVTKGSPHIIEADELLEREQFLRRISIAPKDGGKITISRKDCGGKLFPGLIGDFPLDGVPFASGQTIEVSCDGNCVVRVFMECFVKKEQRRTALRHKNTSASLPD